MLQQDPGSTTLYLPGEQLTATGSTVTGVRIIPLPSGGDVVRTGATTSHSFEIPDSRGTSTLALDNTAQNPTWRQFTPYGAPRGQAVTWADNRGYLNKPADTATGLTILGARQYDPVTGQFISPDPVLNPGDPQDLDAYSYSEDNPVTYADPTGLCRLGDPGGPPVNCSGQPVPVSGTPAPQNQDPGVYDPAPPSTGCGWAGLGCAWNAVASAGSWLGNQGADLIGGIGNGIYDTISAVPSLFAQLFNQLFDAFPTGATADGQLTFSNDSHVSVPHSPWHVGNPGSIAYRIGYYAWPLLVPAAAAPEEGAAAADAGGSGLGRALTPKVTAYAHTTPDDAGMTGEDLYAFGNKTARRAPRPVQDFGVSPPRDTVGPYSPSSPADVSRGASTFIDAKAAGLTGQYHLFPAGIELPDGLAIHADGADVGEALVDQLVSASLSHRYALRVRQILGRLPHDQAERVVPPAVWRQLLETGDYDAYRRLALRRRSGLRDISILHCPAGEWVSYYGRRKDWVLDKLLD